MTNHATEHAIATIIIFSIWPRCKLNVLFIFAQFQVLHDITSLFFLFRDTVYCVTRSFEVWSCSFEIVKTTGPEIGLVCPDVLF